ncbi:unnamed protein product, partial [Porites evermanni]
VEWILSLTDSFDFKETSAGRKGLRKEQPSQLFVSTISWENLAKLVLTIRQVLDEVEQDEVPREMERSLPAPTTVNIDATDLYSEWKHWSSAFEIYSIASDLQKKDDAVQQATCCIALAPQFNAFSTRSLANTRALKKPRLP